MLKPWILLSGNDERPPQDGTVTKIARPFRRPPKCEGCGVNRSDPPSPLCVGCQAYRDHQA